MVKGGILAWPGVQTRTAGSALLLCLVFLIYANTFPGAFLGDDLTIVRDNPAVQEFQVRELLTTDYWGRGVNSGLYRPITMLSFALNRLLLGPAATGFRAVNVVLHASVVACFARFLYLCGWGVGAACLAAGLFAVHPLHGEVVNLAVGRSELLVALFIVLGLLVSRRQGGRGTLWVAALYGAALLAKEHGVTFLGLLLATDLHCARVAGRPFALEFRQRRGMYLTLVMLTVCWLVARWQVAVTSGAPPDALYATDNPVAALALPARILTALKIQLFYVSKLLLPLGLTAVYSRSSLGVVASLWSPWAWVGLAAAGGAVAACCAGFRRGAGYGLGLVLYAVAFTVTSQVFFPTSVYLAERFAYLPALGFWAALTSLGEHRSPKRGSWEHRLFVGAACAYVAVLGVLTVERNKEFRSDTALWTAAVSRAPDNARALYFLANAHRREGLYADAERTFRAAIASDPEFPDSYQSYADLLLQMGRPAEAAEQARQAIATLPGVGFCYLLLARAKVDLRDFADAMHWLGETRGLYAGQTFYWETRALALAGLGDLRAALEAYRSSVAMGGKDPQVARRLGESLLRGHLLVAAEEVLRAGLSLKSDAQTANLLGVALALQGKAEEALSFFRQAVALEPEHPGYRDNLERAESAGP